MHCIKIGWILKGTYELPYDKHFNFQIEKLDSGMTQQVSCCSGCSDSTFGKVISSKLKVKEL